MRHSCLCYLNKIGYLAAKDNPIEQKEEVYTGLPNLFTRQIIRGKL